MKLKSIAEILSWIKKKLISRQENASNFRIKFWVHLPPYAKNVSWLHICMCADSLDNYHLLISISLWFLRAGRRFSWFSFDVISLCAHWLIYSSKMNKRARIISYDLLAHFSCIAFFILNFSSRDRGGGFIFVIISLSNIALRFRQLVSLWAIIDMDMCINMHRIPMALCTLY